MAVYRRESRRRPILVLLVITSLALISLDTGGNGIITSVRHTARDAISPVQGVVQDGFNPIQNVFDGVTKVDSLREQNARLKARISELEGSMNEERAIGKQVSELELLLDLPNIEDATGVVARVIGGPPGNFERTLTLNKGTDKGIVIGMPIVAGKGLVGKITDASKTQSTVTLIDSPGLGVGVRTQTSGEQALTQGRTGDKLMRLAFIGNPRTPIEVNELVFTAGAEGAAYPPDLAVGRVVKVDRDRGDLDPDVFVEPIVDLNSLVFVKALRWPPRASGG